MRNAFKRTRDVLFASIFLFIFAISIRPIVAQQSATGSIQGSVVDQQGQAVAGAIVKVTSDIDSNVYKVTADATGHFVMNKLAAGNYIVEITAPGFSTAKRESVQVGTGTTPALSVSLSVASAAEQVTVEADETTIATQLSPVKALLDAGSARTEITNNYIRDFTSPLVDFTEIMQIAPGTFSVSADGVGLGQSNTSFRGFIDGDYTITYDGIPFEDTNSPTHHSWAFFPGATIGGVDFDRSPGTASDIGPTNFGGSIHLLSPKLQSKREFNLSDSFGSWNTNLIDANYYSGLFGGKNPKANLWFDGQHLNSDGYETYNYQYRTAGDLKFTYKFSDRTLLTASSTVEIVDSNTPNNSPTSGEIAQFGDNYLLDGSEYYPGTTTYDPLWYKFNFYHVDTDFEYIGLNSELGHGWKIDTKAYTYSYSNHQHYNSATSVSSKSAVDKLNAYNRIGDTLSISQASKYGVFRVGLWYEWAGTNRYQIKADPRTWVHYATPNVIAGINFHEQFWTNSVQPFVEYQYIGIPKWTITAGIKDAYYNMSLKQYADNGKIVGSLGGAPYVTNDAGYNSWLPSFEANYRIEQNWSAYAQFGMGSIIPPSNVFDVKNAQVAVTPKPTVAYTYQIGTVLKTNRLSMDADGYYIHFQNAYSSYTPTSGPDDGITSYYAEPASNTIGMEGEGNLVLAHGLSLFLNGTLDSAKYESFGGNTTALLAPTPSAWVATAPHDTESIGLTYKDDHWDLAFFNKRVGSMWNDNAGPTGSTTLPTNIPIIHQAVSINPFWVSNIFLNYTLKHGSRFADSKLKLSINNLFDNHNVVALTAANAGTSYAAPYTPNSSDTETLVPGRSFMGTVQISFGGKGH